MKRVTVIFSSSAIDDVEQAVAYYEEKQTDLGKRFAAQVQLDLSLYLFFRVAVTVSFESNFFLK